MNDFRKYMIFNISELNLIDFTEVLETSADTVRTSVSGAKSFVKWDERSIIIPQPPVSENAAEGETPTEPTPPYVQPELIPASVKTLVTKEGPYTHAQFISILNTAEWTDPNPQT